VRFPIPTDNGKTRDVSGKRIYGPDFKNRIFILCSDLWLRDGFLESVDYYVVEYSSGLLFSVSPTKQGALQDARENIRKLRADGRWLTMMRRSVPICYARRKALKLECERIWAAVEAQKTPEILPARRRKVFSKSNGQCHYCEVKLDLHGDWHIEHQTPLSRGGPDRMENMVAACVPCNIKKGTKTEEEFRSTGINAFNTSAMQAA
jgi:hypothetical protein